MIEPEKTEPTPQKSLIDQFKEYKDKATEITGYKRPEDIPQVSDWLKKCKLKVGRRKYRVIQVCHCLL